MMAAHRAELKVASHGKRPPAQPRTPAAWRTSLTSTNHFLVFPKGPRVLRLCADGFGAYAIDTLAILAVLPGQVRAYGCPEEQEHDREDKSAERRSLRDPRRVPRTAPRFGTLIDPHVRELLQRAPRTRDWRQVYQTQSIWKPFVLANCEGMGISEVQPSDATRGQRPRRQSPSPVAGSLFVGRE